MPSKFRRAGTTLSCVLAAAGLAACSGSGSGDSSRETAADEDAAPRELVERCQWIEHDPVPEKQIRSEFTDRESGDVRLALSDPTIRPGRFLSVAVINDSSKDFSFGEYSHIETTAGERVRIGGAYGFRAILLGAEAHGVGPCVSLPVPSDTAPGEYFAVLDDTGGRDGAPDLRAAFEVTDDPITKPRWEVLFRVAGRLNRAKRKTPEYRRLNRRFNRLNGGSS